MIRLNTKAPEWNLHTTKHEGGSPGYSDPPLLAHVCPMSPSRVSKPWRLGTPFSRMQHTCSTGSKNGKWYHSCRTFRGKTSSSTLPHLNGERVGCDTDLFTSVPGFEGLSRGVLRADGRRWFLVAPPETLRLCLRSVVLDQLPIFWWMFVGAAWTFRKCL